MRKPVSYLAFFFFMTLSPVLFLVLTLFSPFKKWAVAAAPKIQNRVVAAIVSMNNFHVLKFLSKYFELHFGIRNPLPLPDQSNVFSFSRYVFWPGGIKVYLFLWYIFLNKSYGARYFWVIFRHFNAFQDLSRFVFDQQMPRAVFFANDHNEIIRPVQQICKQRDIPCFYLQHAAVTETFPPLLATAAFLYGEKSLEVYQNIGPVQSNVHLVGHHKFDGLREAVMERKQSGSIAVCTSLFDEEAYVLRILKKIKEELPDKNIVIRPHPRQILKRQAELLEYAEINNSVSETIDQFLQRMDVVIAHNSSVLLEAALTNCYAIQIRLSEKGEEDVYGFQKDGIVDIAQREEDLTTLIRSHYQQPVLQRSRAGKLDASIASDFEFAVEGEVMRILREEYGV